MQNVLLENVEFQIDKTLFGVWRHYLSPTDAFFAEFKAHRTLFGLPPLHYTRGICPETGKRLVAKGIVAVGRDALHCRNRNDRPDGLGFACNRTSLL
jgi:hypothetical protein